MFHGLIYRNERSTHPSIQSKSGHAGICIQSLPLVVYCKGRNTEDCSCSSSRGAIKMLHFSDPCWRHSLERYCANTSKRHNCISQHCICVYDKVQREAFHQISPLRWSQSCSVEDLSSCDGCLLSSFILYSKSNTCTLNAYSNWDYIPSPNSMVAR